MNRIAGILSAAALAAGAQAQEEMTTYYVGHHAKFVNIVFESQADIETIVGSCNAASGEIRLDAGRTTGSVNLTVPVGAMKTGIDLRDEHLRSETWLDAGRFPTLAFASRKVEPVKDAPGRFTVTGDLTVHGVAREAVVTVSWKELSEEATRKGKFPDGKWLKFAAEFKVKLSDHGVKIPDMAVGKVSDEWTVRLAIFACTGKPEAKK